MTKLTLISRVGLIIKAGASGFFFLVQSLSLICPSPSEFSPMGLMFSSWTTGFLKSVSKSDVAIHEHEEKCKNCSFWLHREGQKCSSDKPAADRNFKLGRKSFFTKDKCFWAFWWKLIYFCLNNKNSEITLGLGSVHFRKLLWYL